MELAQGGGGGGGGGSHTQKKIGCLSYLLCVLNVQSAGASGTFYYSGYWAKTTKKDIMCYVRIDTS